MEELIVSTGNAPKYQAREEIKTETEKNETISLMLEILNQVHNVSEKINQLSERIEKNE
jgi:hypothetical protein